MDIDTKYCSRCDQCIHHLVCKYESNMKTYASLIEKNIPEHIVNDMFHVLVSCESFQEVKPLWR